LDLDDDEEQQLKPLPTFFSLSLFLKLETNINCLGTDVAHLTYFYSLVYKASTIFSGLTIHTLSCGADVIRAFEINLTFIDS
jgi:hypothetical protein